MIQDIDPLHLDLTYTPCAPLGEGAVFAFSQGRLLGREKEGELTLPRVGELPGGPGQFLFSMGGRAFYLHPGEPAAPAGYDWLPVRGVMDLTPQADAFAAVTAYHLAQWYRDNRFCGRCGRPLTPGTQERSLVCGDCGNTVYPRINPAVIVGVTQGDKLLLTRYSAAHGGYRRYALVAGFCEIGETAEDTVRREVWEEVGLHVGHVRYFASQPWGVAGNLSLGYFAQVEGDDPIRLEEAELCEARWFDRADVPIYSAPMALTTAMMLAFKEGKA